MELHVGGPLQMDLSDYRGEAVTLSCGSQDNKIGVRISGPVKEVRPLRVAGQRQRSTKGQ